MGHLLLLHMLHLLCNHPFTKKRASDTLIASILNTKAGGFLVDALDLFQGIPPVLDRVMLLG
jgi:hypothetical protein